MALSIFNIKKHLRLKPVALGCAFSLLTLSAAHSVTAQTSNPDGASIVRILTTLDFFGSSECTAPQALTITSATDNGGTDANNVPSNAIDGFTSTRWSSDPADIPQVNGELVLSMLTLELSEESTVTDLEIAWFQSDARMARFEVESSLDNITWQPVLENGLSSQAPSGTFQAHDVADSVANYIRIIGNGNTTNRFDSISELVVNGCIGAFSTSDSDSDSGVGPDPTFGLDPTLEPWENFDLSVWGLDSPAIENVNLTVAPGRAAEGVRIDDFEFVALRDRNSSFNSAENLFFGQGVAESTRPYFFTGPDGGMVFKSPVNGARTSSGTRFPRSELREYVRGGVTRRPNNETISTSGVNENNWVLGYQPNLIFDDNGRTESIQNVGGRNGRLAATLRVNKVTETGRPDDVGVTIIGQIHAQDDEPLRLYYRKLPGFDLGSVYAVHELRRTRQIPDTSPPRFEGPARIGRDAPDINLVGVSTDLDDLVRRGETTQSIETLLADGIALDELFSYEIINEGSLIIVNLIRGDFDDPIIASTTIDMATIVNQRDEAENDPIGSGYNRADEWMYFKAGAYTQNNSDFETFDNVNTAGAATTGFGPNGDEPDFDQATFYRISVSHDDNDVGTNGAEDSDITR